MLTLCDTNYTMKEWLDEKWLDPNLKIFPWTAIWHKFGLNTLSCYGDRAPVTLLQIGLKFYSKTRTESTTT